MSVYKEDNLILYNDDCIARMDKLIEQGIKVDCIITDPPYKVTSRGSSGSTGGMLKEEINKKGMVFKFNNIDFKDWLDRCYSLLKDGSHTYFMINNKNLLELQQEIIKSGFNIYKILIWNKNSPITNMYYMDTHEYIVFCRKGKAKKINNCGTKSVLSINNPRNKKHPTEKPVELMKILIENSSDENDVILDPFMGSGSTGVACKKLNRKFIGIELDKEYYDIAVDRVKNVEVGDNKCL